MRVAAFHHTPPQHKHSRVTLALHLQPFVDCELQLAAGATETIVVDEGTKYFLVDFYNGGNPDQLYPDANLHFPSTFTIKRPDTAQVGLPPCTHCSNEK